MFTVLFLSFLLFKCLYMLSMGFCNHKRQRTQRKQFYYTIAVQRYYTDGHAVLMFALFFLNVFSLLALTFVAVTISRSV